MAAITKTVLAGRVLEHLGVIASNETAASGDTTLVETNISLVVKELEKIGTLEVSFTDLAIPDWAQSPMRDVVSLRVAPSFGVSAERLGVLAQVYPGAWELLLRHFQGLSDTGKEDLAAKVLQKLGVIKQGEDAPPAHDKTVDDVSEAVFDFLTEDGTLAAGWTTLANTPEWAEPFLANMVAYRAAHLFGVADPARLQQLRAEHDEGYAEIVKRNTALAEATHKTNLRNKVAVQLGLIAPGQTPTAAQAEGIDDASEALIDWLDEVGTLPPGWTALTAIPEWAETYLRDAVAFRAAPILGIDDQQKLVELKQLHDLGISEIVKRFTAITPADTRVEVANDVAQVLGLVSAGEEPATAIAAELADAVTQFSDWLDEVMTATPTTVTALNDWELPLYRDCVAFRVAEQFGVRDPNILADLAKRYAASYADLIGRLAQGTVSGTDNQIYNLAAQKLGLIRPGEGIATGVSTTLQYCLDAWFDWADEYGTPGFTKTTVPAWALTLLADYVAFKASHELGVSDPAKVQDLAARSQLAQAELLKRFTAPSGGDTAVTLRYDIAHALGVVEASGEPDPSTAAVIDAGITWWFDWADERGTVGFTSTTIPAWATALLRDAVAAHVAEGVGIRDQSIIAALRQKATAANTELVNRFSALAETDIHVDIVNRIATHLGLTQQGEVPTAAQAETIGRVLYEYDRKLNDLMEGNMPGLSSDSPTKKLTTVPDWMVDRLKKIGAYLSAGQLGVSDANRLQQLRSEYLEEHGFLLKYGIDQWSGYSAYSKVLYGTAERLGFGGNGTGEIAPAPIIGLVSEMGNVIDDWFDEIGTPGFTVSSPPVWTIKFFIDVLASWCAPLAGVKDPTLLADLKSNEGPALAELKKRFTALGETATKTILRNMALRKLGVIGMAEDPSAAQIEIAEELVTKAFSHLRAERTITFPITSIPDWAMVSLSDYCAYYMKDAFGAPPALAGKLYNEHVIARKELRAQVAEMQPMNVDPISARYY